MVNDELDAATIEARLGLKEKDYVGDGGNTGLSQPEESGFVRRRWIGTTEAGEARPEYALPKYTLYWNVETPDIVGMNPTEASGDDPSGQRNAPRGMKYLILVNRTAFANLERGTELPDNPWWHGDFPVSAYTHSPLNYAAHGYSIVGGTARLCEYSL